MLELMATLNLKKMVKMLDTEKIKDRLSNIAQTIENIFRNFLTNTVIEALLATSP